LAIQAPFLGWPDHQIKHRDFFPKRIHKWLRVLNSGGQDQLCEGQNCSCYCNSKQWHAAAYMDGAWVLSGHCMRNKWCPCWMCVMFRTNFWVFPSQMTLIQRVYVFS
jgi:hypothetical protein